MFDLLIPTLEELDVGFTEDYELGELIIDVSTLEKTVLISVIGAINESGMMFTIDEQSIVVSSGEATEEYDDLDSGLEEEEDYTDQALNEALGM